MNQHPNGSSFSIVRRLIIAVVGMWCVVVVLGLRLADVAVIRGDTFRLRADQNRFGSRVVVANRGVITDRNGGLLVKNTPQFFRVDEHTQERSAITPQQALDLMIHDPEHVVADAQREQVYPEVFTHLLGMVGFVSGDDQGSDQHLYEKEGKSGLEKMFDASLDGVNGSDRVERTATGKETQVIHEVMSEPGKDLQTSIDAQLGVVAYEHLQGRKGSVVVSDIATSQVLALVSAPSYTPDSVAGALRDPDAPLINRATSAYPPGSVFKMITALGALQSGAMQTDTKIRDDGELSLGGQTFRNWYFRTSGKTEGEIDLVKAIARSNDIFFYKAAELAGPDKLSDVAKMFHFGMRSGIELGRDDEGVIPTPAWKERVVGEKWYTGDTYHMGIGQGDVLVTPMQVNVMTATLARRGVWCQPTLLLGKPPVCEELPIVKTNFTPVIDGMLGACSRGGTGFPFFAYNETAPAEARVACKTGTAEHGAADSSGKRSTHAWFTMFYPVSNPKVAITVMLESTQDQQFLEGSADAAPIAKAVWEEWKRHYEK